MSLPERFNCLKKIACALFSAFGSTYLCEQIFSHMKHILSPQRCRLTTEHSESCMKLKVYIPDVEILSKAETRFALNFLNLCWKFMFLIFQIKDKFDIKFFSAGTTPLLYNVMDIYYYFVVKRIKAAP